MKRQRRPRWRWASPKRWRHPPRRSRCSAPPLPPRDAPPRSSRRHIHAVNLAHARSEPAANDPRAHTPPPASAHSPGPATGARAHQASPPLPAPRQIRRQIRMAAAGRHPQPHQASPTPARRRLTATPAAANGPDRPAASKPASTHHPTTRPIHATPSATSRDDGLRATLPGRDGSWCHVGGRSSR